ncbi:SMODS domain-containing nucleotidyltransferase [Modestobacter roseus]|uniref:SMODS domain-containing nucleotidyltransferase n=1 Tax=Modestobacter roseus TaxID=1181884 RepID=UPI001885F531|nr:hypothetical protein [Modestobacter roseus]
MTSTLVDEYVKTLAPTPFDKTTVADRHGQMEAALDKSSLDAGLWFESGSWSHGTALKGHSDVDYMAWASGTRPARPSSALATMKSALVGSHWAITNLRVSSPTVKVQFVSAPHFEVVPAWLCKKVGEDRVFWIPGPGDQWTESAPHAHLRFVSEQNDRLGKKVKPLARLLKQWKANTGAPVSSFYLEMRTAEYAKSQTSIFYHLDLNILMNRLIDYGLRDMNDPIGVVTRINAVSSEENRRTTLRLLREARDRVSEAYDLDGKPDRRYRYWELMTEVFGSDFPYPTW